MIALVVVIGIAVALSVAGWVSLVSGSFRGELGRPTPQRTVASPARETETAPDAVPA